MCINVCFQHLKRGYLADLFLDTPVCNAHTTGCDILWGSTPLITVPGMKKASRVASSLLNAIGLPQLVCPSLKDYENLAVNLAEDMPKLWEIRKHLEESRLTAPLFDTERWVRNLERGLDLMWMRHEQGLPPSLIEVADIRDGARMEPIVQRTDAFEVVPPVLGSAADISAASEAGGMEKQTDDVPLAAEDLEVGPRSADTKLATDDGQAAAEAAAPADVPMSPKAGPSQDAHDTTTYANSKLLPADASAPKAAAASDNDA